VLMPKEWFQEDWKRALELKHAQDCRAGKCHMCGVISRERELCQHMLKNQRRGRIEERKWKPKPREAYVEPPAVQRLRFRIGRKGEVRFLSHLEMMRAWIRTLRRARAPLSYSQGFHAHPKVTFASAAPVCEESEGDYMDVILKEFVEPEEFLGRVQATLPEGFLVFSVEEVPIKTPSLMSVISGATYTFFVENADVHSIRSKIDEVLQAEEVIIDRKAKAKSKRTARGNGRKIVRLDIRPMIESLVLHETGGGAATIEFSTTLFDGKLAKPREILALLGLDPIGVRVLRRETALESEQMLVGG